MTTKPPLDSASVSKLIKNSQRIVVLGAPGSGKSFWAKKLSESIKLPLYSLDQIYWQSNWQPPSLEDFREKCEELCTHESWIIEGNFGATFDSRWSRADLVIYLDPNPLLSFWRQVWRGLGLGAKIQRPKNCQEWRGLKTFTQLFWLTIKFRGAHGVLISNYMRQKYPDVSFIRRPGLDGLL